MTETGALSPGLLARVALEKHGFRASHSLGQNFILDDELISRIVSLSGVRSGDGVLEIGPGAGVMTSHLAKTGASVTCVELDKGLKPVLDDVLAGEDVRVVFGDFLKLDLGELMGDMPFSVVANLPYYITADAVMKLLTSPVRPQRITIMVQKEASQRMMASPGEKIWCALAATVQYYGRIEALMTLPPSAFTPAPHVDSVLMGISISDRKPYEARDEATLLKLIGACFAMRRKTLANNLTGAFSVSRDRTLSWLRAAGISDMTRGEALSIGELCRLSDIIYDDIRTPEP